MHAQFNNLIVLFRCKSLLIDTPLPSLSGPRSSCGSPEDIINPCRYDNYHALWIMLSKYMMYYTIACEIYRILRI
jgi:hypothetical protein